MDGNVSYPSFSSNYHNDKVKLHKKSITGSSFAPWCSEYHLDKEIGHYSNDDDSWIQDDKSDFLDLDDDCLTRSITAEEAADGTIYREIDTPPEVAISNGHLDGPLVRSKKKKKDASGNIPSKKVSHRGQSLKPSVSGQNNNDKMEQLS